jgi:hypothetical protein
VCPPGVGCVAREDYHQRTWQDWGCGGGGGGGGGITEQLHARVTPVAEFGRSDETEKAVSSRFPAAAPSGTTDCIVRGCACKLWVDQPRALAATLSPHEEVGRTSCLSDCGC